MQRIAAPYSVVQDGVNGNVDKTMELTVLLIDNKYTAAELTAKDKSRSKSQVSRKTEMLVT